MPAMKSLFGRRSDKSQMTRSLSLRTENGLVTLDEGNRTIGEVVAATENPVEIYDWEHGRCLEVLLMSGCRIPKSGQVSLLNSHWRSGVEDVLGSAQGLHASGRELLCRTVFSGTPLASEAWEKVREGHLTDFSVGYRILKSAWVPEGKTKDIGGRTFTGPVLVRTSWEIKELSICPIGADPAAKGRTDQGGNNMPEWLRKQLEAKGLRSDAAEQDAWRMAEDELGIRRTAAGDIEVPDGERHADPGHTPEQPAGQRGGTVIDLNAARDAAAEGARGEFVRQQQIQDLCREFLGDDGGKLAVSLIAENKSVDAARGAVMDKIKENSRSQSPGVPAGSFSMGLEDRDKFRAAAVGSLMLRGGMRTDEKKHAGAESLRGYSLMELCRESLRMEGKDFHGAPIEMVGRAMTTSDFPNILADVAHVFLLDGFAAAVETFDLWTDKMPAGDFKESLLIDDMDVDKLLPVGEHGEVKVGYIHDRGERIKLGTFARKYAITRPAIINNDVNLITAVPRSKGKLAKETEGDCCYAVLTSNPKMSETGSNLFSAKHGNLVTGALPGWTAFDAMQTMFAGQKGPGGKTRNIPLQFVLVPWALQGSADRAVDTIELVDPEGNRISNSWSRKRITPVPEARLDDHDAKAWYGAGPKGTTVMRTHLDGNEEPYMEVQPARDTDAVEWMLRYDVAAAPVNYRALAKNPGVSG